jgi:hypothetical protein
MARRDQLNRIADDYVQDHHSRLASLRAEAEKLRERLVKIEAEIVGAGTIADHRRHYQPEVNGTPACPYCFLDKADADAWLCGEYRGSFTLPE